MAAPFAPSEVQVAGVGTGGLPYTFLSTDMPLRRNAVAVRAKLADEAQPRRLVMVIGTSFSPGKYQVVKGPYVSGNNSAWQTLIFNKPLTPATNYRIRVFTENAVKVYPTNTNPNPYPYQRSSGVDGSVWANRPPVPEIVSPAYAIQHDVDLPLTIDWTFTDPDDGDAQTAYIIQYRLAAYGSADPGATTTITAISTATQRVIAANTFSPFVWYEWRIRLCDGVTWGDFTDWRPFFTTGDIYTPLPLTPIGNSSIDTSDVNTFTWKFRSELSAVQSDASLRYRAVGSALWTTVVGSGPSQSLEFPSGTFLPSVQYEWQVQTLDSIGLGNLSDWSISGFFWTAPQTGSEPPIPDAEVELAELGCGTYRVFLYERGGQVLRGEITPIRTLQWDRRRDDISQAILHTNGFNEDCGELLRTAHCWMHEIVIFRDGERVWEGPIVRITESVDGVEIDARDPMVYVYRRIMRMGYNDTYPNLQSVVYRSTRIIQDALGYDDPNVLPYLTPFTGDDDAREARLVEGWTKTAWEEVDDLAANAGLDYTTVGRRIILWDVHNAIGVLPEMRNGDFSDPLKVTEYGMSAANVFAVTNNAGVYGVVQTFDDDPGPYGHIEQIASAYGEATADTSNALTAEARAKLQATMRSQADRNINRRYPAPVVVRVPDNTTVMPHVGIGINQLVPGVHIPLRSVGVLREVTQVQKLDQVTVTYNAQEQEKIKVILSPAPSEFVDTEPEVVPD